MSNKLPKIKIVVLIKKKKDQEILKIDFLLAKDSICKIKRYNSSHNFQKLLIRMRKNKLKKVQQVENYYKME